MTLERDSKAAKQFVKISTSAIFYDENEKQYTHLLTPYAAVRS